MTEHGRGTIRVPAGVRAVVYTDWLPASASSRVRAGRRTYDVARGLVAKYWRPRLSLEARISVLEEHAANAERALLIAQLIQDWRYGLGNS